MPTHHSQDGGDRSDSLSPILMQNSNQRTWNAAIADDEPNIPPRKRPRLEDLAHESSSDATPKVRRRLTPEAYTVAWVAALPLEMAAATAMLDETHEPLIMSSNDSNLYVFGNIGDHNVVIACLPSGQYGITKAALLANNMRWSFPCINIRLMVGIGGGVPMKFDIRLGDVVVSCPTLTSPGVIQYDFGKTVQEGRIQTSRALNKPPQELLVAVAKLRAMHESQPSQIPVYLAQMITRNPSMTAYTYQGVGKDRLYEAGYDHVGHNCDECDLSRLVERGARPDNHPKVHYGVIASANQVMKHGYTRDRFAQEHEILCFEMEAAGLMDSFPCLVIRGICDYSDTHKTQGWQEYAAATAAAYTKELLNIIPARRNASPPAVFDRPVSYGTPQLELRQVLLESLKLKKVANRHFSIQNAHANTCQWLLKHPDVVNWLDPGEYTNHHGVLWISGKPGAGKSTIMKFVFDWARRKATKNDAVVSFFFNARGELLERTSEGMYRSLLVQLLERLPGLQSVLEDVDLPSLTSSDSWNIDLLRDLFSRAISKLDQQQAICFIDAIDECAEEEILPIVDFFEDLGQCAIQNNVRFYACFSSRHYPHISTQYGLRFTLEDQADHTTDMEEYTRSKLRTGTAKQTDELVSKIMEKASGVFLWVVLATNIINKEFQRGRIFAVGKHLSGNPSTFSDLFSDIITRSSENMDDLLLCIQWILFSKTPLKPEELYFALVAGLAPESLCEWDREHITMETINLFITSASKGLAMTTKSRQPTVQFVHEGVRGFLLKDNGLSFLWPTIGNDPRGKSHERLKECCQAYTSWSVTTGLLNGQSILNASTESRDHVRKDVEKRSPFLQYATRNILYHSNAAGDSISQDDFVREFSLQTWIAHQNLFEKSRSHHYSPAASLLYILADQGLASLIRTAARHDTQVNTSGGERYETPLLAAIHNGNTDAVKALLSQAPLQSKSNFSIPSKFSSMCEGFYLDYTDEVGRRLLFYAAKDGHYGLMVALLYRGFNVNTKDLADRTPLSYSTEKGHGTIVRELLECGADANCPDSKGRTPLSYSTKNGHGNVVTALLEKGANVDYPDKKGRTPLMVALEMGKTDIAQLLLRHKADANKADNEGRTPLFLALKKRQREILKVLLDYGADPNIPDPRHGTLLSLAILEENREMVQLLLNYGVDVEQQNPDDITPLSLALDEARFDIAALLVEHGAVLDGRWGQTLPDRLLHHLGMGLSALTSEETYADRIGALEILSRLSDQADLDRSPVSNGWTGYIRMQWEIPMVYRELEAWDQVPSASSPTIYVENLLSKFVVLTGDGDNCECTICAASLENRWGDVGLDVLRLVSLGIANLFSRVAASVQMKQNYASTGLRNQELSVMHAAEGHITIRVDGYQRTREFIEALVWMCTAMRPTQTSPHTREGFFWSTASRTMSFLKSEPQILGYRLDDLQRWRSDEMLATGSSCWTKLFRSGIVARHRLQREWGKGLEVSFAMMVHLAAVENFQPFDRGVILLGFYTALIPVAQEGEALQWHFESVEDSRHGCIRPDDLKSTKGDWLKVNKPDQLQQPTCFVGWFQTGLVLLGTRELTSDLDYSRSTKPRHMTAHRKGFEFGGQFAASMGPINAAFQGMQTFAFTSNIQRFNTTESYIEALRNGRSRVALIIDSETKQAWLVPVLSLILHLCHQYFRESNKHRVPSPPNPIPFAEARDNGHEAVMDAVKDKGNAIVLGTEGSDDKQTLRQLFLKFNTSLYESASTREKPESTTIFASELMGMVNPSYQGSPLREVDISGSQSLASSWKNIINGVDVVGVCAGLGQAIRPVPTTNLVCEACLTLPQDRFFLAAHMRCLDVLSTKASSRLETLHNGSCPLGFEAFWCIDSDMELWTICRQTPHASIWGTDTPCRILQRISDKKSRAPSATKLQGPVNRTGVVVFGIDCRQNWKKYWQSKMYDVRERRG